MESSPASSEPSAGSTNDVEEQFRSLQEGLRTTLPGVQIITAFLLTLPLYDKFADLTRPERVAYYTAFVTALVGSVLLMAPSAHQRLRAGTTGVPRHSRRHLASAIRLTIAGTVAFAVALTAVAYLVSSLVLGTPTAIAITACVGTAGGWSWFYLPLVRFERHG